MVLKIFSKSKVALLVLSSILFVLLSASVIAPFTWLGNVTIGTNTTTDGAIIGAYIGASASPHKVVETGRSGFESSAYVMTVGCSAGDTVFLKVWGLNSTSVTCMVGPQTGNTTNLSISGLVASGGACTYTSACTTVNVCCSGATEINDGATTGATCSAACSSGTTTTTTTTTTTGGGGGGGGTAIPLISETVVQIVITGATSKTLEFTKSADFGVKSITLLTTSGTVITDGKVTVKQTNVGTDISSALEKDGLVVYQYLSITKQSIKNSDLDSVLIQYEVPVTWINANSVDASSIMLYRFVSDQWNTLPTTRVSSSSTTEVYSSETPTFSIFAIAGGTGLTAFQLIDIITAFFAGTTDYTAFQIIDLIRDFYA